MHEAQRGRVGRWLWVAASLVAVVGFGCLFGRPAHAVMRYGPLQLSGNVETYNLVRHPNGETFQFIKNRNTARLRVDLDWVQNSKFLDKVDIPFIDRSNVFLLYRGWYDSFYEIEPGGNQIGQTAKDDKVGGPIGGNGQGNLDSAGNLRSGPYSRYNEHNRTAHKRDNSLRELYVDAKIKDAPLSFRVGRQQVIWGESDLFRMLDMWNPLDLTWHLQQEKSWDEIRVPLWLIKGLWDIGMVGPLSNSYMEVVYNAFDHQPSQKLDFLPNPWSAWVPSPLRQGQVQQLTPGQYVTPYFDLNGSSFRHGAFKRNPEHASEVGARFHSVTPFGLEFTVNYLHGRVRQSGASNTLGVKFHSIDRPIRCGPGTSQPQCDMFRLDGQDYKVLRLPTSAEIVFPYVDIFGISGNYFESDYTQAVFRFESVYQLGAPVQSTELANRQLPPGNFANPPQQLAKTDVWAGMVGLDRPTWIKFLNPRSTWFISSQIFWSYYTGNVNKWVGTSGISEAPYFTPPAGQPGHNSNGFGRWVEGPRAGLTERLALNNNPAGAGGDNLRRWESLWTVAAFSFYRGGTLVPFVANALDPVNGSNLTLWYLDYFVTNNLIVTLQQKYFARFAGTHPADDPWGAAGRNVRRDETGVKLVYQF
jgi:hypothetical protein